MSRISLRLTFVLVAAQSALVGGQAWSQTDAGGGVEEVVVTARKREETAMSVPVVLSALSKTELERKAIITLDDVARFTPGLIIGEGGGTLQGGNVALRGLGGADNNPLGDQAVAFDMDGVAIARATIRRLSEMDMQQVEVLKGPQALFFGKNSPGGVISIRTADPTNRFEAKISETYEAIAHEWRTESYVSGPVTETLGARLAVFWDDMRGWSKDTVPQTSPFAAASPTPDNREAAARLTLKWEPTDRLRARAKIAYSKLDGSGSYANQQYIYCPFGQPQPLRSGMVANCKPGDQNVVGNPGAVLAATNPADSNGGVPYNHSRQTLGSLETNYDLTHALTLTSVSGYYDSRMRNFDNFTSGYYAPTVGAAFFRLDIREISEELRLNSSFAGPLNFTVGGYYQHQTGEDSTITAYNAITPLASTRVNYHQKGWTYSEFAQLRWAVIPTLEIAAGARYSAEHKQIPLALVAPTGAVFLPLTPRVLSPSNRASWYDVSPESTVTWRPKQTLTVFAAYKTGFLSGGFNTGSQVTSDIIYNPETIKGVEGGVKGLLLERALRTDLAVFHYKMSGLQVTVPVGPLNTIVETNAGGANIDGAELNASYLTPVEGLKLSSGVAYTRARYSQYLSSCYSGQPAPACAVRFNPLTGRPGLSQDLEGAPLVRAPDWSGNVGFDYERPIGSRLQIGLTGDMTFSSSYFTSADNRPAGLEKAFQLFDATLRLADQGGKWEIAFIGRNLTNVYYFDRSLGVTFTGSPAGGQAATTTPADVAGLVSRGRELMVRASWNFGK